MNLNIYHIQAILYAKQLQNHQSLIISCFLATLLSVDLNVLIFPLRVHCIAPQLLNCSRSVNVNFCHDFANSVNVFFYFCLKIFLILESIHKIQRSCLFKFNCRNEIREMPIFWKYFENQASLIKDPTHDI